MQQQYYGSFAEKYGHTESWENRVIPGMLRALPKADEGGTILDLGCGAGHFLPYAQQKGYQHYCGIDLSSDMIKRARANQPDGEFLVASATQFTDLFSNPEKKFDAIVSIMMLSTLPNKQDVLSVFQESHTVLKPGGVMVLCTPHPAFDSYMLHESNQGQINTTYKGYFAEGQRYNMVRTIDGTALEFTDYHWTLQTLLGCIIEAGLHLTGIDECKPQNNALLEPSHIIVIASK